MHEADRSTIWPYDERGEPRRFYYSRSGHPAGAAAEAELGRREDGDALLYSSGMGAATTVLLAFARPGTRVALAAGCYYGTSKLLGLLSDWGISYVEYDQTTPPPAADIVWVEAPANPVLSLPAWEHVRAHAGLVVCDATIATPVYLRALDPVADARAVETATELILNATSLGGAHSTMESRARWEAGRVPPGLLRLSVGLEDVEDLWADLERALERTAQHLNV